MSLSNSQLEFLKALGQYLNNKNIKSFLVGGCVRDLLLNRTVKDLDIMLEADATEVLSQIYSFQDFSYQISKPVLFKKYKTAKAVFTAKDRSFSIDLDFSSARKEIYPEIGANPVCEAGSFNQDLARRDFSINALAYSLFPLDFNTPIDLFGGLADLSSKLIRVLHDLSFRDDPARLIRAARFSMRFGFLLESKTKELLIQAREGHFPSYLTERRSCDELRKALAEDCWRETLGNLSTLGLLEQFCPELDRAWKSSANLDLGRDWKERIEMLLTVLASDDALELRRKFGFKNVL